MKKPLYQALAAALDAARTCEQTKKTNANAAEWRANHLARVRELVAQHMPSGAGIDNGTKIDIDRSTGDRLVFTTAYHHMNDTGHYDGWTEHTVTVRPSLAWGFRLTISGRDRNEVKDYLTDVFVEALNAKVDEYLTDHTPKPGATP